MAEKKKDPRTMVVKNARLSFPHIFKAQENQNDNGTTRETYNCVLMIPKEDNPHLDNTLKGVKKCAYEAKKKAWGDNEKDWPRIPTAMTCFKDGDNEDHFTTPRAEYADHYILSCSSPVDRPPRVITDRKDGDGLWIDAEMGKRNAPYAGCYVNAIVELYGQKKDPKRQMPNRVNASFSTIQFLRDGEPFTNRGPAAEDMLDEDDVSSQGDLSDDIDEDDDDDLI